MPHCRYSLPLICASLLLAGLTQARSADIVLGHPTTPYGDAFMEVVRAIIEDRIGIPARSIVSSNPVTFKAMDANKGDIDVGSIQLPNSQSLIDEYVTRRGTVVMTKNQWQFNQGVCTTKATADKYGIKSVYDMTKPEVVQLTAQSTGGKGEYWVGAAEWNSTAIERARARYYGLSELYNLTTSQPEFEYARVANAIKTGTPIFWSCDEASNFIFPKDSIALLQEPPHDPAKWRPVMPSQDPDWYQKTSVETSWPTIRSGFVYAKHLQTDAPDVVRLLENIALTREMIATWTYATVTEKRDKAQYARDWVKANPAIVDGWLK